MKQYKCEVKRYVLAYDLHYPKHDKKSWSALMAFVKDVKPDGFIFGGDNLDMKNISRHEEGRPGNKLKGGYQADLVNFEKEILRPLEAILPSGCDKRFILANHEAWLNEFYAKNPEFEGAMDIEDKLQLEPRGWQVIQSCKTTTIGKLHVLHGEHFSGANCAKKMVETLCQSSIAGHTHTYQAYTKTAPIGKKRWVGWTVPTLGTVDAEYAKHKPNAGLHGFAIVETWNAGEFNVYVPIITHGVFSYAGKLYGGKPLGKTKSK